MSFGFGDFIVAKFDLDKTIFAGLMNISEERADNSLDFGEGHSEEVGRIEDEDAVIMSGEVGEFGADGLVETAAGAITTDRGLDDLFRNNNCKTLVITSILRIDKRNLRGADSLAILISVFNATAGMKTVSLFNHIIYITY